MRNCLHYQSKVDLVAIKFKCCQTYYGCYYCHLEKAGHDALMWEASEFQNKAVLCCACQNELTIEEYLTCKSQCIHCGSAFNLRCESHWGLYFSFLEPIQNCNFTRF